MAALSPLYSNLSPATANAIEEVDRDFRREYDPQNPETLKKKGCGVCFYKVIDGEMYVLLGQLKGKRGEQEKLNGTYATFAGKAQAEDFASSYPSINMMKRELREEFGNWLSNTELEQALDQITTLFLKNATYPKYKNPIFFIEATPQIAQSAEFFGPSPEIHRVRWIKTQTILDSAYQALAAYKALCISYRVDFANDVRKQMDSERRELGDPPLTDDEFSTAFERHIQQDPRLQAVRDGIIIGRTQNGMSVQIAPYSARSICAFVEAMQEQASPAS